MYYVIVDQVAVHFVKPLTRKVLNQSESVFKIL